MNGDQFRALLWLRWRLFINQMRRAGVANAVILAVLAFGVALAAVGLSAVGLLVPLLSGPSISTPVVLFTWDGLVVAFLFFWMMGLLFELQRSEVLSLDKILHLPVSLRGAFLINYLSSLVSLSLLTFGPAMVALAVGMTLVKGPALLVQFPLLAAFVLMVTALTYQFRGWLASLMANPRRRRTVIVLVTMAFILLAQLPNLLNIMRPWKGQKQDDPAGERQREMAELWQQRGAGKMDQQEFNRRSAAIEDKYQERDREEDRKLMDTARLFNLVLPPGWLPLGAADAADGNVLPALLGTLGMGLIGAVSLGRSYRTTLRLYTGQFNSATRKAAPRAGPAAPAAPASVGLLERELPWVSERAGAIALCGFRSLLRAPEAKMMLLSPLLMVLVFGSLYWTRSTELPDGARPLVVFGAMTVVLLSMAQVAGNLFGFDRAGFRVFVLSAAPRRDILLGKNLALAPIALGLGLILVGLLEVLQPLRLEHLVAVFPEFVCLYLPYCLLANLLSIIAPMPIRAGSFKPVRPGGVMILLHLAFALACPLMMLPALLPLGVEFLLDVAGWATAVPVCLILALAECVLVVSAYRLVIGWQGRLLQSREQKILEVVTTRTE